MPIFSGGGGGGGGLPLTGGTLTGALAVAPTTDTLPTLFSVTGPTGFEAHTTGNGWLASLVAEDGTSVFNVDTYGFVQLKAPTGQGRPGISVLSTDTPSSRLDYAGGQLAVTDNSGEFLLKQQDNTVIFDVAISTGVLRFHLNAAPADGALVAGDCALWFDSTNGAAKLMAKAKTADGTVVTASIALA